MAGKKGQLGGLFVELGFKGQPLLKGLDVAAGKFSLIKHAATEAVKIVDNAISGVAAGAAELNKIQAMTGFAPTQLKQWREWEKINHVTEGTVARTYANIAKMQELARQNKGWQNLPLGYQKFHISPFQSPEAIVKQFKQVATQQGMSPLQQQVMLDEMGITPEFIALLDGTQSRVNDNTRATEKETQALVELDRSVTTLKDTATNLNERVMGEIAPKLTSLAKLATRVLELPVIGEKGREEFKKDVQEKKEQMNKKTEQINKTYSLNRLEAQYNLNRKMAHKLESLAPGLKESTLWNSLKAKSKENAQKQIKDMTSKLPAKTTTQLETIKDMKDNGAYNPGLPPMPNVGGSKTVNDNRQVTNNVNVTVNGADVDKNNLQYTLLDNINNATNLNAISDYSRRNRDDL